MIQIMANENMDEWQTSPSVLIETVKVTKQFLDEELAKYKTFEDFQKSSFLNKRALFVGKKGDFLIAQKGVGQGTIVHFLGKGWEPKGWAVSEALKTLGMIKEDILSEEAVKELPSIHHLKCNIFIYCYLTVPTIVYINLLCTNI